MSSRKKLAWAEGRVGYDVRNCRACGPEFKANSGPHCYCSPRCKRDGLSARRYGLTAKQLNELLEVQGGVCGICGETKRGWGKASANRKDSLVVDHCHDTNQARGFLCGDCNTALGRFGDSVERLELAIEYLKSAPSRLALVLDPNE